jgi:DNA phosphorothioation-dependent restriction protein DptH
MSNQFFSYITTKINDYLVNVSPGERYYFQLEKHEDVEKVYATLQEIQNTKLFQYQHNGGAVYETFYLEGKSKVIIAATVGDLKPDYLVTIRNLVSEQEGEWNGTSVLFVTDSTLDSIKGGCTDLQKSGMPLSISVIIENMKCELMESPLLEHEKSIIEFYLSRMNNDDFYQPDLWEYEDVLGILQMGKIETIRYKELGIFSDPSLATHSKEEQIERLRENHKYYAIVQKAHQYDDIDAQLRTDFGQNGVNKFRRDNWAELTYQDVLDACDELRREKSYELRYFGNDLKPTESAIKYWERPNGKSKAGERTRNIIVFNNSKDHDTMFKFKFDDYLSKEYLKKRGSNTAYVSGKSLIITLHNLDYNTEFHQIEYKHKGNTSTKYVFNIAVVKFSEKYIEKIKTDFTINYKKKLIKIDTKDSELYIGFSAEGATWKEICGDERIEIGEEAGVILVNDSTADEDVRFTLVIENSSVPFQWKAYSKQVYPLSNEKIWNLKREKQEDFVYDFETHKIRIGTEEFSTFENMRRFYAFENEIVENSKAFVRIEGSEIVEDSDIELDSELQECYYNVLKWYKDRRNIPTFTYISDEGVKVIKELLEVYVRKIDEIKDKSILTKKQKNMSKIGMAYNSEYIYLTPFHPIMLSYQLRANEVIGDEELDTSLVQRLSPANLLPYIIGTGNARYKSKPLENREWLAYETIENAVVGDTNQFLAEIVREKLEQFMKHFEFLFVEGSNAPILLNVVGIKDDKELVKGIIIYLLKMIEEQGVRDITPFKISLYNSSNFVSELEILSTFTELAEILNRYKIPDKKSKIDPLDIMSIIKEKIMYSKQSLNDEFSYAHITFFKMQTDSRFTNVDQDEIETGLSLQGLISSLPSVESHGSYRSGYGVKNLNEPQQLIYKVATRANELMANMDHEGHNVYQKKISVASVITDFDQKVLEKVYDASHWVTFIDPNVGFDFFTRNSKDLVIIHYNDQYTTSTKLDAITVTKKVHQYKSVLKEILKDNKVKGGDIEISKTIQDFNTMNGEWLLRMVSRANKASFTREKLSILSSVKVLMGYLEHPNIQWIPVSLEEILRVAGAIKLSKKDGLFSTKNLGSEGAHSDDILMIGIEDQEEEVILHYYPVEVKVGHNGSDVINKARIQIKKTASLLKEELSKTNDKEHAFRSKIYRNFFIQVLLSNYEKLKNKQLNNGKETVIVEKWKSKLLDDQYDINYSLENYIGIGAVVSFRSDAIYRSIAIEDGIAHINMTEQDAYSGIVKDQEAVIKGIQDGSYGFLPNKLISSTYNVIRYNYTEDTRNDQLVAENLNSDNAEIEELVEEKEVTDVVVKNLNKDETVEDVRLLIGTAENSSKKIYWEYGHKSLSNRHILISGKSGQGKSYLIQCLLLELSKNGLTSIIIDYTDGFKKSKLEPEFRDALGDNLEQFIVASKKFPINPFKRNKRELDEDEVIDEDDTDIAERIKSVFGSVYKSLGIQQLNSIYEAVMRGLKKHGSIMNLSYLLEELEEDTTSYAKTAASTIKPLIDKNPFDNTSQFNWDDVFRTKGKVFIIQLTGYMRDVQLIITEFILWDLWNYKLQSGTQEKPFSVILDEAQNLDHSEKSPSAKVLTEGRKFGWSGWYATQFMKGQMSSDEIMRLQNSGQKLYFAPPEGEIASIAGNLSNDPIERKSWENSLKNLKKGQCIFVGATQNSDKSLFPSKTVVVNIDSLKSRK